MNDDPARDAPAVIADFWKRIADADGETDDLDLEGWQARYPGFEEVIADEWDRLGDALDDEGISRDDAERDLVSADRIGPYRLLEEIGRGGQGVVHRAVDTRLGRTVALKVLGLAARFSKHGLARFRREAAITSRLEHPGLCPLYDVGEDTGRAWIATKLIEGSPLSSKYRDAASPRDLDLLLLGFEHVARALHVAHEAGIIHRDVKPANILVDDADRFVLVDFGIARSRDETVVTSGDVLVGTPAYLPPEVVAGDGDVDRRGDVYSLGASLYECVTGRRPFDGPTRDAVYHAILTGEAPRPTRLDASIRRDVEAVIETAIEKDRDRRYSTAESLADDLQAVRENRPVSVRPLSPLGRSLRWMRRHPLPTFAAGLALLLFATAGYLVSEWSNIREGRREVQRRATESHLAEAFRALSERDSAAEQTFRRALDAHGTTSDEAWAGIVLACLLAKGRAEALRVVDEEVPDDVVKRSVALQTFRTSRTSPPSNTTTASNDAGDTNELLTFPTVSPSAGSAFDLFIAGHFELVDISPRASANAYRSVLDKFTAATRRPGCDREIYFLARAWAAYQAEDRAACFEIAGILRETWPDSAESWFAAGTALSKIAPAESITCYERALELRPNFTKAYDNIGRVHLTAGRSDEALLAYERAVEGDPTFGAFHAGRGLALRALGRRDEAIEALRRGATLAPTNAAIHVNLGTVLAEHGMRDAAITSYRAAVQAEPNWSTAHRSLGLTLIATGDAARLEEAHRHLRRAHELTPGSGRAHEDIAYVEEIRGQLTDAVASWRKAIELDPTSIRAHRSLARLLHRNDDLEGAVESYRAASRLAPGLADVHLNMGAALHGLKRYEEAIAAYRRALEHAPTKAGVHFNLGVALEQTGKSSEALASYRRAVRHDPNKKQAVERVRVLEERGIVVPEDDR